VCFNITGKPELFWFNGKYWDKTGDVALRKFIREDLSKPLRSFRTKLSGKSLLSFEERLEKMQEFGFGSKIIKRYKTHNTRDDVRFDEYWNLLGFKDKVYDLNTGQFRGYEMDDYISTVCNFDWRDPTVDEVMFINKLIRRTVPDKYMRKLFLQMLCSALDGRRVKNIFILTGSALYCCKIVRLLANALGNYCNILSANDIKRESIIDEIGTTRLAIFTDAPKKLGGYFVENIVGVDKSETRKIRSTIIIEAGKVPPMEDSIAGNPRIIEINLNFDFTKYEDDSEEEWQTYIVKSSNQFHDKYRYALLQILMDEYKEFKEGGFQFAGQT
jgi:hypothetical protein